MRRMSYPAGPREDAQVSFSRKSTTVLPRELDGCEFEAVVLAMAGHDLRQPLQVIQNVQERLDSGMRTRSELHLLELCQKAIDRLTAQLDQLLSALRVRERGRRVELAPVGLEPAMRQVRREYEVTALQKGVQIGVVPCRSWIMSDALLLSATLGNLVSNAVKYTEPGGRILVGCRHFRNSVRIDVLDTGIGISEEHIAKIFDAFTRVDATHGEGLGVGLFIVRQAIAVLGHRLEVSSVTGCGTRFSIWAKRACERLHTPQGMVRFPDLTGSNDV
jgi:two-component system phosphate regulon sensor histidine kinase PhoR